MLNFIHYKKSFQNFIFSSSCNYPEIATFSGKWVSCIYWVSVCISIHYLHFIISFGDLSSKNDTKGHKNVSKESNYKRGNIIIIPQNVLDHLGINASVIFVRQDKGSTST